MAASSGEPHEGECPVCANDFTIPKILPCGHLLCQECVIAVVDSKLNAICPLCRCPIVESRGQSDQNSALIADNLPTDFVMQALVESALVLAKDPICCVCDIKADFICMQCMDMMCLSCSRVHSKFSVSRSHDVETISTVTPERLAASRPALCADHGDKQALFCVQHGLALCLSCSFLKHRECRELKSLDHQMKSADSTLGHLKDTLASAEKKLEQAIHQLDSRLQEVDVGEQKDLTQLDKIFDNLQKVVEECRSKLKERTRVVHSELRSSLHVDKTMLSSRLGKLTSHRQIVMRARAVAPRPALIQATKAFTDRVNSLDFSVDLTGHAGEHPAPSVKSYEIVVRQMENGLQRMADQRTAAEFQSSFPAQTVDNIWNFEVFINDGVLITLSEPMAPNVLYQLRVDETNGTAHPRVLYGISRTHPTDSQVVLNDFSRWLTSTGIVAGLMADSVNNLNFYENGNKSETKNEVTGPYFAFFRVRSSARKITLLPVVKMT